MGSGDLDLSETYAEVSPSGTGIRMIARGKVEAATKYDPAHVEIYGRQRYLTVTGNHLPASPTEIREAPRTIEALLARVAAMRAEREAGAAAAAPGEGSSHPPRQAKPALNFFGKRDPDSGRPPRARPEPKPRGDNFFRNVNDRALVNIGAWAPVLFPQAKHQPGTGAYRVPSRALGRNLQENISIAPDGIVDFGVADMGDAQQGKRMAIDLVLEWGDEREAMDAAHWLCDRMGVAPDALGWRERQEPPVQAVNVD